jgi:hypothetical protein
LSKVLSAQIDLTFFLWYWDLNSGPTPWTTPPALFYDGFFWGRGSRTICPGWLQTVILISASWAAGITGVSHQHPLWTYFFTPLV